MTFQSSFKMPRNAVSLRDKLWRAVSNPWWLGTYLKKEVSPVSRRHDVCALNENIYWV